MWPGTHQKNRKCFAEHGPEALIAKAPYPPTDHPYAPKSINGKAGDLFLAHYLLGHNIGDNLSGQTRKALYFRLRTTDHRENWQEYGSDPLYEFAPVRKIND